MLTNDEIEVLIQYIDLMDAFDDDEDFRLKAVSARAKLVEIRNNRNDLGVENENEFYDRDC